MSKMRKEYDPRYFSDELDAQIFYSKKEHMFTFGTICAKI